MKYFSNKTILVTGGAGFVGSNLVERLLEQNNYVTVVDDFSTGSTNNLKNFITNKNLTIVKGDIRHFDEIARLCKNTDIIFHYAVSDLMSCEKDPHRGVKTNINGTLNILDAARKNDIKKIVYASSASVYGNGDVPMRETDPTVPSSIYGITKLAGELLATSFHSTYGLATIALRYFNVYGKNQSPSNYYSGVIARFMSSAIANKPLTIYGDGNQTRDFTFVRDAIDATLLAVACKNAIGEVFNIGTGVEVSINQLAKLILTIIKSESKIKFSKERILDVRRRVSDISKAMKILKFKPIVNLEEGLRKTLLWYKQVKNKL